MFPIIFQKNEKLEAHLITPLLAEQKAKKLLGRKRIPKGLFLFIYDKATAMVTQAKYDTNIVTLEKGQIQRSHKVKEGEAYCFALNLKTATKKFEKQGYKEK
jgi:hypothetical protein